MKIEKNVECVVRVEKYLLYFVTPYSLFRNYLYKILYKLSFFTIISLHFYKYMIYSLYVYILYKRVKSHFYSCSHRVYGGLVYKPPH